MIVNRRKSEKTMEYRLPVWSYVSTIWFFILAYYILLARDTSVAAVRRDRVNDEVRYFCNGITDHAELVLGKFVRTVGVFDWD